MKLAFLFTALAFAQATDQSKPAECAEQKQEIERLNKLVDFYRNAYLTVLESKIAPKAAPK